MLAVITCLFPPEKNRRLCIQTLSPTHKEKHGCRRRLLNDDYANRLPILHSITRKWDENCFSQPSILLSFCLSLCNDAVARPNVPSTRLHAPELSLLDGLLSGLRARRALFLYLRAVFLLCLPQRCSTSRSIVCRGELMFSSAPRQNNAHWHMKTLDLAGHRSAVRGRLRATSRTWGPVGGERLKRRETCFVNLDTTRR